MVMFSYLVYYNTLLQNGTDFIIKCNTHFITKCDKSSLQNSSILLQNMTFSIKCAGAATSKTKFYM